jgi:hypothetical protein
VGVVNTNTPVLSWAINTLPVQPVTGDFTIEFADVEDKSFDTILYSKNVGYKYDLTAYVESITLSGASAGDQFRYRIKNEKRYQPISGETITDIVYSDVNKMELGTNSGNSY